MKGFLLVLCVWAALMSLLRHEHTPLELAFAALCLGSSALLIVDIAKEKQ